MMLASQIYLRFASECLARLLPRDHLFVDGAGVSDIAAAKTARRDLS